MATVVTRTTSKGETRRFVVFNAIDRRSGEKRKHWELVRIRADKQPGLAVRESDAKLRANEIEIALHESGGVWPAEAPAPAEAQLTVKACGESWLKRHKVNLRGRVHANYEASLKNHVYPTLGTRRMVDIGPADAKELRDAMRKKKLSDDTIRAALVPFRGMVRDWAENVKRPDPIAGLRLFGKGTSGDGRARKKITAPDAAHIAEIAEHARIDAREAIFVAAATGLRRGELFGLRWRDCDFETNEIRVTAYNFGAEVEDGRFKTDAAERTVPLFRSVRQLLLERQMRQRYKKPEHLLFGDAAGNPLEPNNFVRTELKHALASANAARSKNELPELEPLRWHSLRHFAVSALIAQGADILTIARIAGHSDPAVTLRVYSHLLRGAMTEAAEKFEPLTGVVGA
jgi:integrase